MNSIRAEKQKNLDNIEVQIRDGKASLAKSRLIEFCQSTVIEMSLRARAAELCYRVGVPMLGIRILHQHVHPDAPERDRATPAELAVYAQCLTRIGGSHEASSLLERVDDKHYPKVFFFRALAHVARWEYAESLQNLKLYKSKLRLDPYDELVADLNIAAAEIFSGNFDAATKTLEVVRSTSKQNRFNLLYGNALELSAQVDMNRSNWEDAERWLTEATIHLEFAGTVDAFMVSKWKSILEFLKTKRKSALLNLRQMAESRNHWETIRDCDLFEACEYRDRDLFLKLYFGTPFTAYRENLVKRFGEKVSLPRNFIWTLKTGEKSQTFDLSGQRGFIKGKRSSALRSNLLFHLASDFYRPIRLATLFHLVYPDTAFHPTYSRARIHEIIRQTRKWLGSIGVPLEIEEADGLYRFRATAPVNLLLSSSKLDEDVPHLADEKLKIAFKERVFTHREATELTGLAPRSVSRILKELVDSKKLIVTGRGKKTSYLFLTK